MTNPREALEEAFKVIHCANDPAVYRELWTRFRRFLDAEAWTDAAMCLVPEGALLNIKGCKDLFNARINLHQVGTEKDVLGVGPIPALALAQACLKARENGDG